MRTPKMKQDSRIQTTKKGGKEKAKKNCSALSIQYLGKSQEKKRQVKGVTEKINSHDNCGSKKVVQKINEKKMKIPHRCH